MRLSNQWFLNQCDFIKITHKQVNPRIPVLDFTSQSITQYPEHTRKWSSFSQGSKNLRFDKTIQQIQKHQS